MFFRPSSSSLAALLITAVSTAALPRTRNDVARVDISSRSVTTLTSSQLSAFTPFTQFARAAYCDPSVITGWTCGGTCPLHFVALRLFGSFWLTLMFDGTRAVICFVIRIAKRHAQHFRDSSPH